MAQSLETLIASANRLSALAYDDRFDAQARAGFRKSAKYALREAAALVPPANLVCVGAA